MAARSVRHILEEVRHGRLSASMAAEELGVTSRHVNNLLSEYLRWCAKYSQEEWEPGRSGGAHKGSWPPEVEELLRLRLSSKPPSSYAFAASEAERIHGFKVDRGQVRHWALQHGMGHSKVMQVRAPIKRWQRQNIGELWQLDATPHAWFPGNPVLYPMINMLDDCSRLYVGSQIYERETLMAYLDFMPAAFLEYGLPLAIYVDYHSMFFTQQADALTELGRALMFYEVSFRYAPTPQAKGKVEREHLYWQGRLPALFAADRVETLEKANQEVRSLRLHRNSKEPHRELQMTAQTAWDQALAENRTLLRKASIDAWWPFVWSKRISVRVDDDGRVSVGTQRIRVEVPRRTRIVLCQHPTGHQSLITEHPDKSKRPIVLFSNRPT